MQNLKRNYTNELTCKKAEEQEVTLPTLDHRKSKKSQEKHLVLILDYATAFDCVEENNCGKF